MKQGGSFGGEDYLLNNIAATNLLGFYQRIFRLVMEGVGCQYC
jgi:hypothetical protein